MVVLITVRESKLFPGCNLTNLLWQDLISTLCKKLLFVQSHFSSNRLNDITTESRPIEVYTAGNNDHI